MPPAFRNHLVPTGCDTPASSAASSLLSPVAIARQNLICSSRPAAGGRPGEGNGARPDRADRRFRMLIATSNFRVLRRPLESAQLTSLCKNGGPNSSELALDPIRLRIVEITVDLYTYDRYTQSEIISFCVDDTRAPPQKLESSFAHHG